jgi:hypothetical protein
MSKYDPKYLSTMRRYNNAHPWISFYSGARGRCKPNGVYGKRGITFELTCAQVKDIWFRDNAALMKRPSIDRINTKLSYTLNNTRFIEHEDNLKRPKYFAPNWRDYSTQAKPKDNTRQVVSVCTTCGVSEKYIRRGYGASVRKTCKKCAKRKEYYAQKAKGKNK